LLACRGTTLVVRTLVRTRLCDRPPDPVSFAQFSFRGKVFRSCGVAPVDEGKPYRSRCPCVSTFPRSASRRDADIHRLRRTIPQLSDRPFVRIDPFGERIVAGRCSRISSVTPVHCVCSYSVMCEPRTGAGSTSAATSIDSRHVHIRRKQKKPAVSYSRDDRLLTVPRGTTLVDVSSRIREKRRTPTLAAASNSRNRKSRTRLRGSAVTAYERLVRALAFGRPTLRFRRSAPRRVSGCHRLRCTNPQLSNRPAAFRCHTESHRRPFPATALLILFFAFETYIRSTQAAVRM